MYGKLELEMGGGPLSEKLAVKLQRVGQEYCDAKKRHEQRSGYHYDSLHFVLFGSGTLITSREKRTLSRGDVFLLFEGEEYEYYPSSTDPWSYIWVDFRCNDTPRLFEPCGITREKPYVRLSDLTASLGFLKSMYEAYDASERSHLVCTAYLLLLMSELMKNAARTGFALEQASVKQRHVREILTYINNNYRLPLTLADIAAANHISVSRMMGLFSEVVGMSPIAYLNRYRVSYACELLRKSNSSIGEVSNAVGVEDRLYFSRLFRKWRGMSPREYRQSRPMEDPFAWLKEKNIDFR